MAAPAKVVDDSSDDGGDALLRRLRPAISARPSLISQVLFLFIAPIVRCVLLPHARHGRRASARRGHLAQALRHWRRPCMQLRPPPHVGRGSCVCAPALGLRRLFVAGASASHLPGGAACTCNGLCMHA
jgi:hypothetical protein